MKALVLVVFACVLVPALALAQEGQQPAQANLNSITAVNVRGGTVEIVGTKKLTFTTFTLPEPFRLVIDISEAVFSGVKEDITVGNGTISGIRTASYGSDETAIARVVIGYERDVETDIQSTGNSLVVSMAGGAGTAVAASPTTPAETAPARTAPAGTAPAGTTPATTTPGGTAAQAAVAAPADQKQQERAAAQSAVAAPADQKQQERAAAQSAVAAPADQKQQERAAAQSTAAAQADQKQQERAAAQAAAAAQADQKQQERAAAQAAAAAQAEAAAQRQAQARAEADRKAQEEAARVATRQAEKQRLADERAAKEATAAAEKQRRADEARTAAEEKKRQREEERQRQREEAQAAAEEKKRQRDEARQERLAQAETPRQAPEQGDVATSGRSKRMTVLGFRPVPTGSRVFIQTNEPVTFNVTEGDKQVVLELEDTRIDMVSHARRLDTSFFETAVVSVNADAGPSRTARVTIRLKERVSYQTRQDGNELSIEFQRPDGR